MKLMHGCRYRSRGKEQMMSDIAISLIGLATILNGINIIRILKRLDEDEIVITNLIKGVDDE